MNPTPITIKDDDGADYIVEDIKAFQRHLLDFHATGSSVHTENGHRFTVTPTLRQQIDQLAESSQD